MTNAAIEKPIDEPDDARKAALHEEVTDADEADGAHRREENVERRLLHEEPVR